MPMPTMYYRFQWAGDADYPMSDSVWIPVPVKPSLGKEYESGSRPAGW